MSWIVSLKMKFHHVINSLFIISACLSLLIAEGANSPSVKRSDQKNKKTPKQVEAVTTESPKVFPEGPSIFPIPMTPYVPPFNFPDMPESPEFPPDFFTLMPLPNFPLGFNWTDFIYIFGNNNVTFFHPPTPQSPEIPLTKEPLAESFEPIRDSTKFKANIIVDNSTEIK